jgi:sigma-B regulation protein RsbU (phosphoserine phosphatase)
MLPDAVFGTHQVTLEPGDLLITFTDGVLDARNPAGQLFTEKRLLSLLQQPIPSALTLLGGIEANLRAHIGTANQFDDITMLAARRLP